MLLLGPLPGLIAGWALLLRYKEVDTLVGMFAVILITINYLNLLPFKPLDGGQLIETVVLHRFPYVSSIATFFSGLIFGLGAFFAEDMILAAVGAVLIFVSRSQGLLLTLERLCTDEGNTRVCLCTNVTSTALRLVDAVIRHRYRRRDPG